MIDLISNAYIVSNKINFGERIDQNPEVTIGRGILFDQASFFKPRELEQIKPEIAITLKKLGICEMPQIKVSDIGKSINDHQDLEHLDIIFAALAACGFIQNDIRNVFYNISFVGEVNFHILTTTILKKLTEARTKEEQQKIIEDINKTLAKISFPVNQNALKQSLPVTR